MNDEKSEKLSTVILSCTWQEYLDIIAQISNITLGDTSDVTQQTMIIHFDGQETVV